MSCIECVNHYMEAPMTLSKKETPFIVHFLISLLISYFVSTCCIIILGFLLYKFHISIKVIDIGIVLLYIISNFTGGYICGKNLNKRKYLGGLMVGTLYFIVMILLSLIMNQSFLGVHLSLVSSFLLCTASGMMGGCISSSTEK